jgi:5-methylcytosine-specific restriction endonuclease McrA
MELDSHQTVVIDMESKKCTQCGEVVKFSDFYPDKRGRFGLRAACKACEAAYARSPERRERDRIRSAAASKTEERKAYMREYQNTPGLKEKKRKSTHEWYLRNKETILAKRAKWRLENAEYKRGINAKWKKENRALCVSDLARYRAAKLNATPLWADLEAIKRIYEKAAASGMEVDHIIPLRSKVVCGLHVENNLQLLTREQNASKGNKWPLAYGAQNGVRFGIGREDAA